jgi:hypothetical protein
VQLLKVDVTLQNPNIPEEDGRRTVDYSHEWNEEATLTVDAPLQVSTCI